MKLYFILILSLVLSSCGNAINETKEAVNNVKIEYNETKEEVTNAATQVKEAADSVSSAVTEVSQAVNAVDAVGEEEVVSD